MSGPARPHHTLSLSLVPISVAAAAPPGHPPPPDVTAYGTHRHHLLLLRTSPRFGHPSLPPSNVGTSILHHPDCLGRTPLPRSPRATWPGRHHTVRLNRHRPDLGATQHRPSSALMPAIAHLSIPDHHRHRGQRVCYFTQQIKALFAMIKVYASSILCSQTQELKVLVNH
jgi:hypothetical protein